MFSSTLVIGGAIVVAIIVILGIISFIAKNYIKVPPNEVAVFYGRKYGNDKGFKVITGGARFKVPIIENVQMLKLNMFTIDLMVSDAPNKDGVPVSLKGVANVKLLSDEASLMAAAERFLGMPDAEVKNVAFKNLEGHLRSIAGKMTIEELVGDRQKLNQTVLQDAEVDLKKLGLGIDLLTIQEVTDKKGYIEQLGKKRTAEVLRDAQIGSAEAEREAEIKTTAAKRESVEAANLNLVGIAESDKERDVKKANFQAQVAKETATAEQAGPMATAEARKGVVQAEQEVLLLETQKKTEVAKAEAIRIEQELQSTVVKPAEAEKQAGIINAEAKKTTSVIEAEGRRQSVELDAEAAKKKKIAEGEGEAEAIRVKAIAEAEGIKAKTLAQAEGTKAALLAEAEGILKKAEAYQQLDASGKTLQMLEALERILPAVVKEFAGVMEAAAKPLGNVDSIQIIDFGGGSKEGGSALGRFGQTAPEMITKLFTGLKAAGFDPAELFDKLGLDSSALLGNAKELPAAKDQQISEVKESPLAK